MGPAACWINKIPSIRWDEGDSRGATQVTLVEIKIPVVRQQGGANQRHFFQVRSWRRLIPLLYNGSPRSRLLIPFRLFNSEVHSAVTCLPRLHRFRPGSLKTVLQLTRPRRRFVCYQSHYKQRFPTRQAGIQLNVCASLSTSTTFSYTRDHCFSPLSSICGKNRELFIERLRILFIEPLFKLTA